MSLPTRHECRTALAALLEAAADAAFGAGAVTVYGHMETNPGGLSPLVALASEGSDRTALTARGNRATYTITVNLFVLRGRDADYTDADADQYLDELEAVVADVVEAHRSGGGGVPWKALRYAEASRIAAPVEMDGAEQYWLEPIPLQVEVY